MPPPPTLSPAVLASRPCGLLLAIGRTCAPSASLMAPPPCACLPSRGPRLSPGAEPGPHSFLRPPQDCNISLNEH